MSRARTLVWVIPAAAMLGFALGWALPRAPPAAQHPLPSARTTTPLPVRAPPCPSLPPSPATPAAPEGPPEDVAALERDLVSLFGPPRGFDTAPADEQPDAARARLEALVADLGQGEIVEIDCEEHPCVAALRLEMPEIDDARFLPFMNAIREEFDAPETRSTAAFQDGQGLFVFSLGAAVVDIEDARRAWYRREKMVWNYVGTQ